MWLQRKIIQGLHGSGASEARKRTNSKQGLTAARRTEESHDREIGIMANMGKESGLLQNMMDEDTMDTAARDLSMVWNDLRSRLGAQSAQLRELFFCSRERRWRRFRV